MSRLLSLCTGRCKTLGSGTFLRSLVDTEGHYCAKLLNIQQRREISIYFFFFPTFDLICFRWGGLPDKAKFGNKMFLLEEFQTFLLLTN